MVLIHQFTVRPEEADQLLRAWSPMRPISSGVRLHLRPNAPWNRERCVFLNYAVRESVGQFPAAFQRPESRERLAAYPPNTVTSPHLFQRVHVPNICVGD